MQTIESTRDIDRLFRSARRAGRASVTVLALESPGYACKNGRVAFIAGKRLGAAVMRNRSKRVMREAVRLVGGPWPGWDVASVANARTATAGQETLVRDLRSALGELGVS